MTPPVGLVCAGRGTRRRARGVVRKAERMPLRRLRDRHERDPDRHPPSDRQAEAERQAARIVSGVRVERPWEPKVLRQQRRLPPGTPLFESFLKCRGAGKAPCQIRIERTRNNVT